MAKGKGSGSSSPIRLSQDANEYRWLARSASRYYGSYRKAAAELGISKTVLNDIADGKIRSTRGLVRFDDILRGLPRKDFNTVTRGSDMLQSMTRSAYTSFMKQRIRIKDPEAEGEYKSIENPLPNKGEGYARFIDDWYDGGEDFITEHDLWDYYYEDH